MMNDAASIIHDAIVVRLLPQSSEVEVVISDKESDSCASCAAAGLCKPSEGRVRAFAPDAVAYKPGQHVRIGASPALHRRAVGLMLGLPCLMLVLPILALLLLGLPEWVALLSGLAACVVTYLLLWLCRKRLNSRHTFTVIAGRRE